MKTFGTAAILACGRSARMGFDKQLLTLNDRYFFEHNLHTLSKAFDDIVAVTNTPKLYEGSGIRTVQDAFPHMGPLAGLHAALSASRSHYVYLIACDMPIMNLPYAILLKDRLLSSQRAAALACLEGKLETFNAFYSTDLKTPAEDTLKTALRNRSHPPGIYGFLKKQGIPLTVIPEEELRSIDPHLELFTNINTPQEYKAFLRKAESTETGLFPSEAAANPSLE